jgi:hypothetical protein
MRNCHANNNNLFIPGFEPVQIMDSNPTKWGVELPTILEVPGSHTLYKKMRNCHANNNNLFIPGFEPVQIKDSNPDQMGSRTTYHIGSGFKSRRNFRKRVGYMP